ncbi:MAG: hypothetical protein VB086_13095 [Clostridiaceae bacterium]|nr:hypothetical protein [Clostridiaceae bacterium]
MSMYGKYKDDYELQDAPHLNGKGTRTVAVYKGGYWRYELSDREYRRFLWRMVLLLVGMTGLYAAMAILPAGPLGSSGPAAPYVLLPYAMLLFPLGMCWGKVLSLAFAGRELQRREYEQWVVRRRQYTVALLLCAAAAGAGGLVYTVANRDAEKIVQNVWFVLLAALMTALCWIFLLLQDHAVCTKLDK